VRPVDDGSTDDTLAYARAAAARDRRIGVRPGATSRPRGRASTGFPHCRAPIHRPHGRRRSDARERLARQLHALTAAPDLAAVGCHVRIFRAPGCATGCAAYEHWLASVDSPARVRAEAFVELSRRHPALAIRAPVLRTVGYRDVPWPEDYDLVLRCSPARPDRRRPPPPPLLARTPRHA